VSLPSSPQETLSTDLHIVSTASNTLNSPPHQLLSSRPSFPFFLSIAQPPPSTTRLFSPAFLLSVCNSQTTQTGSEEKSNECGNREPRGKTCKFLRNKLKKSNSLFSRLANSVEILDKSKSYVSSFCLCDRASFANQRRFDTGYSTRRSYGESR